MIYIPGRVPIFVPTVHSSGSGSSGDVTFMLLILALCSVAVFGSFLIGFVEGSMEYGSKGDVNALKILTLGFYPGYYLARILTKPWSKK